MDKKDYLYAAGWIIAISLLVYGGIQAGKEPQDYPPGSLRVPKYCTAYAGEVGAANSLTGDKPITQVAITCQNGSTMSIEDDERTIRITPPAETK